ncbi:hypothetical protein GCM10010170_098860 [Dactylosporangium salmoneum]|uniref:DUF4838 domain-containing protein n=1 Tax=Dactylosporangium salmoneum TaxID=53361 RepID=A0ABN3HUD9_9ACTN
MPAPATAGTGVPIVSGGRALAVLVLPATPDPQEKEAAADIATAVLAATGVQLATTNVAALSGFDGLSRIYIGVAGPDADPALAQRLAGLSGDGFVLAPHGATVTILGPTPWGTRFGAYEFLERFVGVRWLLPGPDGVDVPAATALSVASGPVRQDPSFQSRILYPYPNGATASFTTTDPQGNWAEHNRVHWSLSFSHNLATMFPPAKYGDPAKPTYHPEFYPIINGQTKIPAAGAASSWQPRFTAPALVTEGVQTILDYFAANPNVTSYALGVNDSAGYSEDEIDVTKLNSLSLYDLSDVYYRWVNAVVEGVLAARPDYAGTKWFGVIAYDHVYDPPSFDLHPRVIPFLTRERFGWIDEGLRRFDQQHTQLWQRRAAQLGWYDYVYGFLYCAPRLYSRTMSEAYRFAVRHGVVAQMSELDPNWGEGVKPWLYSKLLWNADADAEQLADEWYRRVAGPGAAGLAEYHRIWEDVWTRKVPRTPWFRAGLQSTYFPFNDPGYLEAIDAQDVARAGAALSAAITPHSTPAQTARVQLLQSEFEFYRTSVLSYPRVTPEPTGLGNAKRLLATTLDGLDATVALAQQRLAVFAALQANPLVKQTSGLNPINIGVTWSGWNYHPLWDLAAYLRRGGPGAAQLRAIVLDRSRNDPSAAVREYATDLLAVADGALVEVGRNARFEGTTDPWIIEHNSPPRSPIGLTTERSCSGGTSLKINGGFQAGGLSQVVPVHAGLLRSSLQYYVPVGPAHGRMTLIWYFSDAAGKSTGVRSGGQRALSEVQGRWVEMAKMERVPDGSVKAQCYLSLVDIGGQTTFYVDNATFQQLP